MNPISTELWNLAWVSVFTGILWIPIIINRLRELGMWTALRNPQPDVRPEADWSYRLGNAHRNAIENLVVFAPLVLIVEIAGVSSSATATASTLFLISRVAHAVIYTAGIPLVRTIAFVIGFACQMTLALRIAGVI